MGQACQNMITGLTLSISTKRNFDGRNSIVIHVTVKIFRLCSDGPYNNNNHTGQCKRTGGCYNELVVAFFSTGGGVKVKKIYTCNLLFIYKLAFILFVMTPGAQTTGNIAVYGSAKQLVI